MMTCCAAQDADGIIKLVKSGTFWKNSAKIENHEIEQNKEKVGLVAVDARQRTFDKAFGSPFGSGHCNHALVRKAARVFLFHAGFVLHGME